MHSEKENSVLSNNPSIQDLQDMSPLVSLCKRRGFIFPSSEIYGGINACWDYGPLGIELKRNLKESWWNTMTLQEDIEGIDAAILMHPRVWEASGHVSNFVDPLVDCKKCKARFRADQINSEHLLQKECPSCQEKNTLTDPRLFNLMFKTHMGPLEEAGSLIYLRPETAQGIYVNYLNVQQSMRKKIPFGICQIGKAFRNEITPGNFIFRTREFEQMEMQFFIKPDTDEEWFEAWKEKRLNWHYGNGIRKNKIRLHPHPANELAHYAKRALDIQYEFPIGWQELEGIHHRSNYDLTQHQQYSGKKLEYYDEKTKEHYLPYIIETSVGCDRSLLSILADAYRFDGERVWLELKPHLAPYKLAIFPLLKKPDLKEFADKMYQTVKKHFRTLEDDAGSIGKRYRRQDEIGTPFGITIDYETLTHNSITIRHRDTMQQERISADALIEYLHKKIS